MSFSLRELLVAFAIVAAGLTAMLSGSPGIASVFVVGGWLAVVAAAISAILSSGRTRPFCVGFTMTAAILHFVMSGGLLSSGGYGWFSSTQTVDSLESPINHLLARVYDIAFPENHAALLSSVMFSPVSIGVTPGVDEAIVMHSRVFFRVGQMGFLLALAYIGGKFATLVYRQHHPPPEKTTE